MIQYTSAKSFEENKEKLDKIKFLVLDLIEESDADGISNHEMAVKLNVPTATISGVTRPLVIAGIVRQLKKRKCKITGNTVIAWKVVEKESKQNSLL